MPRLPDVKKVKTTGDDWRQIASLSEQGLISTFQLTAGRP
jgi:hypothetical protein